MRFKKLFRTLKLDYDIFSWVKSFNPSTVAIYKNEVTLLQEFKQIVLKKKKNKKKDEVVVIKEIEKILDTRIDEIEEYHLKSPQLGPMSPIYIPASPSQ